MSAISYRDLVSDLSHVLISFVEPMNLKFYFADTELYISEVFSKSGFMSFFLYDKQPFIDYSLRYKKIDKLNVDSFATIHFQPETDSILNVRVDIIHNLFDEHLVKLDNSIYDSFLYSLASKILSDEDLVVSGNKVYLDHKFEPFFNSLNYLNTQKEPIIEKIKGGL